ncbi:MULTISPECIES: alkaline phosphatase family protein [Microbacterium]|uniref:Alkaline phosphatase family protein n=1 Tax=Microbacterium wangchenii TaxID=2541726 RepID=A0ABX5SRQ8_9MICO|nr:MULTISPECIES: alkaline phosphatase family protein [Microbacterium]MCK6065376.1 alkaline phosphatase family protein [Microbacterium sp. EYE_512]QBR88816.1 alkaline phosphatase family protein [Microbacterium wangchenii]TXK20541.1 alkaline phosphatase family protein [Microbacterium wangchenii]
MSLSLPAYPPRARSLTGVLTDALAALGGASEFLPPARSAIVFVIDGLGAANLAGRRGHARFLSSLSSRSAVARTVFPSTTAAALTSLLTGTDPGQHGIVGYRVRVPGTATAPNQLRGWETDGLDPLTWQRSTPILEREKELGRPTFVVTRSEYRGTGFTAATMRGADIFGVDDLGDRVETAARVAAEHPGALVYLYAPDLDSVGHRHGWESDQWSSALERVDAAAARFSAALDPADGALITADHGMVDVPAHRRLLFGEDSPLWDGVAMVGGEPRMLHLYAEPGRAADVHAAWAAAESSRAWVLTRAEAVEAGLFGRVDAEVTERLGDVLVAARAAVAYYDDREPDKASQRMVGQHGSLTVEERIVPLLRLGAFA